MFIPNVDALLMRKAPKRDIHGRESFLPARPLRCAVVRLSTMVEESSVRADSSASRGAADETLLDAKILVPPQTAIGNGDVIQVAGKLVEVAGVHPRISVLGKLDHLEIGGNIKGDM